MKIPAFIAVILILIITSLTYSQKDNYKPKKGFVPDKETAVRIAEAIWLPIYGENINQNKPFKAKLVNGKIWIVEGTMESESLGGVPHIEINKFDCKILKVTHGK